MLEVWGPAEIRREGGGDNCEDMNIEHTVRTAGSDRDGRAGTKFQMVVPADSDSRKTMVRRDCVRHGRRGNKTPKIPREYEKLLHSHIIPLRLNFVSLVVSLRLASTCFPSLYRFISLFAMSPTVHLEMEPYSGPIDLSTTALLIIDMQVRHRVLTAKGRDDDRRPCPCLGFFATTEY
jgi:hypothetical protein